MNNTTMHKTLLAIAIGAVTHSAFAADEKKEDTIVVQSTAGSDFKPGGDQLVPAFLDGQVANGGRMGMLGQQNAMDVPFNIISYTSKLVEDQQAKPLLTWLPTTRACSSFRVTATARKPSAFAA